MGEIIYFQKFEKLRPYSFNLGKKEYWGELTGEYICKDDRVDKFWFTASRSTLSPSEVINEGHFLFKDGSRHDFRVEVELDLETLKIDDNDWCRQAEEFLSTINNSPT